MPLGPRRAGCRRVCSVNITAGRPQHLITRRKASAQLRKQHALRLPPAAQHCCCLHWLVPRYGMAAAADTLGQLPASCSCLLLLQTPTATALNAEQAAMAVHHCMLQHRLYLVFTSHAQAGGQAAITLQRMLCCSCCKGMPTLLLRLVPATCHWHAAST